jgi:predicted Zn finger-like uncharacterized protein
MIIQCNQCKTRFRLDDSKVKESGVRVRCSRCKHTFAVKKEANEETVANEVKQEWESFLKDAQNEIDTAEGRVKEETSVAPDEASENQSQGTCSESDKSLSDENETDNLHGIEEHTISAANGVSDSTSVDEVRENEGEIPGLMRAADCGTETGKTEIADDFHVSGIQAERRTGTAFEETEGLQKESGIDGFPENDCEYDTDEEENAPGISFNDDQPEPESGQSWEIFADKPDYSAKDNHDSEREEVFIEEKMLNMDEEESFRLGGDGKFDDASDTTGEFMEGAEENMSVSKSPGERESVDFSAFGEAESTRYFGVDAGEVSEDELPPLAITSRRKSSRLISCFLAAVLSIVILGGVAVFCFSDKGISALHAPDLSVVANWFTTSKGKEGEFTIKNLDGAFIRNKQDGEYFVMRGEALNQSTRPRTSVQVQGYIYGVKGDVVMKNLAYVGGNISDEQLTTLSLNEIEASLKGKQEKSSGGIVVQPGQGIQFLIVFRNVPKGVGEFGAEAVGSTAVSN